MKLNVLFYQDTANPNSLPGDWPAQVFQVKDDAPKPKAPWVEMTQPEYEDYVAARKATYVSWETSKVATKDSAVRTLADQYDAAFATLTAAEANWGTLSQAQILATARVHNQVLLKIMPFIRKLFLESL